MFHGSCIEQDDGFWLGHCHKQVAMARDAEECIRVLLDCIILVQMKELGIEPDEPYLGYETCAVILVTGLDGFEETQIWDVTFPELPAPMGIGGSA